MMMDRLILGVLYLSGFFIFSTCVFHQYHFVNVALTWSQAQSYCRQIYTDLATIENIAEMNQLINTVSSAGYNSEVWIGLYYFYDWWWTNYIGTNYLNWVNQVNSVVSYCGSFLKDRAVQYQNCSAKHQFICQNGTQLVFVNETMDWFSALIYCRENYTDLTNPAYQQWSNQWWTDVQNLMQNRSGYWTWIGLYKQLYTYWSDGSSSSFRYWDNVSNPILPLDGSMNVVADLQSSGKWNFISSGTTLPFVCYGISKQKNQKVFQLKMKSSVDLNDPAVKAIILKQLQDRLMEKGVSGVTLKWREPDRKVFHKEGETNVTHDGC